MRWYLADPQGSVQRLVDNAGTPTATLAYDAFGKTLAAGGDSDRFGYTGTAADPLTGLAGDDARPYDPATGRWTSEDPIGFAAGDPNLFRYVGNVVTAATDPSGLAQAVAPLPATVAGTGGGGMPVDPRAQAAAAADLGRVKELVQEYTKGVEDGGLTREERREWLDRERQRVWAMRYQQRMGRANTCSSSGVLMEPHARDRFDEHGVEGAVLLMLERHGTEAGNLLWRAEKLGIEIKPVPHWAWFLDKSKVVFSVENAAGRELQLRPDLPLGEVADELYKALKTNVQDKWLEQVGYKPSLEGRHGGILKDIDPEMAEEIDQQTQLWAAEAKFGSEASKEYYRGVLADQAMNAAMAGTPAVVNGLAGLRLFKQAKNTDRQRRAILEVAELRRPSVGKGQPADGVRRMVSEGENGGTLHGGPPKPLNHPDLPDPPKPNTPKPTTPKPTTPKPPDAPAAAPATGKNAAQRGLKPNFEHPSTQPNSMAARREAAELAGLGEDSIPFVSELGPQKGWTVGRQSKDGLRGWRMDWDPEKGYHVNWWDRIGGAKRKDWLYGAVKIEGGTWHDYIELLKHGFGN